MNNPSQVINRFFSLWNDYQSHSEWLFNHGKHGKMNFITPSDFYNAFNDCSDELIERAIKEYQNKKRKR